MQKNYYFNYHNSIISSKVFLKSNLIIPKIKKIVVFFILNMKYYKKNLLLLYIIINFCFYCNIISYSKEINNYQLLKFSLVKKKLLIFFNNFILVYFPILDIDYNIIKKNTIKNQTNLNYFLYCFSYKNFPIIPESEFLRYTNEYIYTLISNYRIKFDIYLKNFYFIKNSLEFLIRIYRFPTIIKLLKNQKF